MRHVEDGEGLKETGGPGALLRGREKGHTEKNDHGGSFAKEFESEKARRELVDRLRLLVKLAGPAHDVGEGSLITGEQAGGGPKVSDHRSFDKSECGRKHAAREQLLGRKRKPAPALPGKVAERRNR